MDCFAEPVIGRRLAPTRWLAMTVDFGSSFEAHKSAHLPSERTCAHAGMTSEFPAGAHRVSRETGVSASAAALSGAEIGEPLLSEVLGICRIVLVVPRGIRPKSKLEGGRKPPSSRGATLSAVAQRAKAEATKQSSSCSGRVMDCLAEPVIGRRLAPTRWLAMTGLPATFHVKQPMRTRQPASFGLPAADRPPRSPAPPVSGHLADPPAPLCADAPPPTSSGPRWRALAPGCSRYR